MFCVIKLIGFSFAFAIFFSPIVCESEKKKFYVPIPRSVQQTPEKILYVSLKPASQFMIDTETRQVLLNEISFLISLIHLQFCIFQFHLLLLLKRMTFSSLLEYFVSYSFYYYLINYLFIFFIHLFKQIQRFLELHPDFPLEIAQVPLHFRTNSRISFLRSTYLESTSQRLDLFSLDVIYPGDLSDMLLDFYEYIPRDSPILKKFDPQIIANNERNGRLVAIPLFHDYGILYYR